MAVVVYKCDTCEREIEKPQNVNGFEIISRCVITQGCRGKLYQVDFKRDFIRGRAPEPVAGLDDWFARKVLYDHTQAIEARVWKIKHNMGVSPSVQLFVDSGNGELFETEPFAVNVISKDEIHIDLGFDERGLEVARKGIAQLVARSSRPVSANTADLIEEAVPFLQVSNFGDDNNRSVWTIATSNVQFPSSLPIVSGAATDFVVSGDYTTVFVAGVTFSTSDTLTQAHTVVSSSYASGPNETTITVQDTITEVGTTLAEISMQVEVTYVGQTTTNIVNTYNVVPAVLTESAWFGVDQIVAFTQRKYDVRGFDIQFPQMNQGLILDGTPFYISKINGVVPTKRQAIILLANSPFDSFDRITDRYIDVAAITNANAASSTYFSEGVLYASENVVSNIYPFIQTV
jgi:hypothetical protein